MSARPAEASPEAITRLLSAWREGDAGARDRLFTMVYQELRRRAVRHLRRERREHTLHPTALVHEAYLRLVGQKDARWQNRSHFFAIASQTMRRVLVDHARERKAAKRPGSGVRVALDDDAARVEPREVDMIALDHALDELEAMDARQSRVVELRFFGGLTTLEIADLLGVSRATVDRDWRFARAWLYGRVTAAARA